MGLNLTEQLLSERLKTITVQWSYRKALDNMWDDERIYGVGLYYISRKFGRKETLLYIGQTSDSYCNRLADHDYNWLGEARGKIFIRLGTITRPANKAGAELKHIIADAERALIYQMQPPYNSMATVSYTPNHLYRVQNKGFRGTLPTSISMREHIL